MPSRRCFLSALGSTAVLSTTGCISRSATGETNDEETLVTVSDGDEEIEAITHAHVRSVGEMRAADRIEGYLVPVELSEEGRRSLADALETAGALEAPANHEMRLYLDGERVHASDLGENFVESVENDAAGEEIIFRLDSEETARRLRDVLMDSA